jgi:hypothetical protein
MSLEHHELMRSVCSCRHRMEDHAWTADDDAYCMMGTCSCSDFIQTRVDVVDYETFRETMLFLLRVGDCV